MKKLRKLKISRDLELPNAFATSTQVILAQKGKGKTHTAVVEAEELLEIGQQIVVLDPTDAWWGLRSLKDGKAAGYPIAVFGGDHGDVDLEPGGGALLATAIVNEGFSAIICTANLSKGKELTFVADFMETLYRLNRVAMHLFVDEADIFAPQKPFGGEARTCGAADDIVRRGRKKGIGCTLITQRSSVLNKNVLSQADMLVALGCSHPRDLDAIGEWVKVHADPKLAAQMMESLPSLPRGDAWVWSPAADIFKRVTIRDRRTFDSGATPKVGEVQREAKVLAPVDIKRLGATIASQVERAKENDPSALKAKVRDLERELTKVKQVVGAEITIAKTKAQKPAKIIQLDPKKADALVARIQDAQRQLEAGSDRLLKRAEGIRVELDRTIMALIAKTTPPIAFETLPPKGGPSIITTRPIAAPPRRATSKPPADATDGPLPPGEVKVLAAIIQLGSCRREQLTVLTGYTRSSRNTYLQRLKARGLIDNVGEDFKPTDAGVDALPDVGPLPTGMALREHWLVRLPPGEAKVLGVLIANRGGVDRETLTESTGYTRSSRNTYLQRLSAKELVISSGSIVKPSPSLFEVT